jgi:NADPH-dependent 2,4-dienoyl-CoA reductase/sulfur reductase-like enzyme
MKTIIIGAVAGGMSTAAKLKREQKDAQITVYEKTSEISYGACGLPYYVSDENDDLNKLRIRSVEEFAKSGIEVLTHHEVVSVDPIKKEVTVKNKDKTFTDTYDNLVVATGASPIIIPIEGATHPKVHTLKSLEDGKNLKEAAKDAQTIAIIGGGYIGLELADAFVLQHKKVVIIEMLPHLLTTFDTEFSNRVADHLKEKGVTLLLNETVEKILEKDNHLELVTDKSSVDADLVVMSVGIRPNTAFLKDTGIKMLRNGAIITDEKMETSIPDIYAAGDCSTIIHGITKEPMNIALGTNANKQGKTLAERLAGKDVTFTQSLGSTMIRILELEVAKTGLGEAEAKNLGMDIITSTITANDHASYFPNPSKITIKVVVDKQSRVLLGAQLIGKHNTALRLNPFVVAIDQKMTVERFSLLDFGYAPPFASTWDAMHIATATVK